MSNPLQPIAEPTGLEIAVIGMAGRFPGARTVDELWAKLRLGAECISSFSDEELAAAGVDPTMARRADYIRAGGVLADVDQFDAGFFGFSPREAELLDPQHRIFFECAWEALEQAGYSADTYTGLIGVCAGMGRNSYLFRHVYAHPELMAAAGLFQTVLNNDKDSIALRTAYHLNLGGPAVTVQTACSTSLVAVHLACQCLLGGEADIVLAGGVGINLPQTAGYLYTEGSMMSPDGHLRAFDARAGGAVTGRGVGIVVLKRLADAITDRDTILAVIKGTAINNDGASKIGYTAPSIDGQARVIRAAHLRAGVEAQSIGYVEAHGTGTDLGDPIEVAALNDAFSDCAGRPRSCALGSLKTNIGHLDAAAGIASLIKTVLMLRHREIPASLHFETPNPKIDFSAGPFYVPTTLQPWHSTGTPRRAGVSSFGMGGTNAHAVLEEAAELPPGRARANRLLVVSAGSESALDRATEHLASALSDRPDVDLDDLAYTLQVGRKTFRHRRMVVCSDAADAVAALREQDGRRLMGEASDVRHRGFAFMFPGQGTQYTGMARSLFESRSEFRQVVADCSRLLEKSMGGVRLEEILYPTPDKSADAAEKINETAIAQPALFVIEYAMARMLKSWGITPQAMIGHSIGEWVAACLAGVFPLEKALSLVSARGRLMQALPRGAMLAVSASAADVEGMAAAEGLSMAASNGPESVVVAGPLDAINRFEEQLAARAVAAVRLRTSHAFHSAMMAPVVEPFAELVARARPGAPAIPFVSNVSGTWITDREAADPAYWSEHLRACVQFSAGAREVLRDAQRIVLEVGPGATLTSLARQSTGQSAPLMLSTIRRQGEMVDDDAFLLSTVGRIWLSGVSVDFARLHQGDSRRRVAAPSYPFERQRFWVDERPKASSRERSAAVAKSGSPDDWCYAPVWRSSVPVSTQVETARASWLIFAEREGFGRAVGDELAGLGASVIRVAPGASFQRLDRDQFVIDPSSRNDYDRLLAELGAEGRSIERIGHLWGRGRAVGSPDEALELGLYSVLFLVQAIGGARGHQVNRLFVATEGALQVMGGDPAYPELAAVHGLLRVVPQEYPGLVCTAIDLAASSTGTALPEADHLVVIREMTGSAGDSVVAVRAGKRWVPGYDVMRPAGAPRLRQNGVYLITGGLSRVGLAIAGYLAREVNARLVLTTRSPLAPREEIQNLEANGAMVSVEVVDITDAVALRKVVASVEARWGSINGIIHAAGVTRGKSFAPISVLTRSAFEEQLLPKLGAVRTLADVFDDRALDFCSFTSSVSTVLGGLGFGAYAAANQAMDAAVSHAYQKGASSWMSVAWEGWNFQGDGRFAVTPEEGVRTFARLIAAPQIPHVVVSTGDLAGRIAESAGAASLAPIEAQPLKTYARPNLQNAYVAPKTPAEKKVAAVWKDRLGVDRVGIHDNFFELGGHSLLASQVIASLRTAFGVPLPVTAIFESPTVQALARAIDGAEGELAAPLAMASGRAARRRNALKRFEADQ